MVFYDAPPDSPALTPLPADLVVGGWVHLRLGLGTLIPTRASAAALAAPAPSRSRAPSRPRRRPSRPPRRARRRRGGGRQCEPRDVTLGAPPPPRAREPLGHRRRRSRDARAARRARRRRRHDLPLHHPAAAGGGGGRGGGPCSDRDRSGRPLRGRRRPQRSARRRHRHRHRPRPPPPPPRRRPRLARPSGHDHLGAIPASAAALFGIDPTTNDGIAGAAAARPPPPPRLRPRSGRQALLGGDGHSELGGGGVRPRPATTIFDDDDEEEEEEGATPEQRRRGRRGGGGGGARHRRRAGDVRVAVAVGVAARDMAPPLAAAPAAQGRRRAERLSDECGAPPAPRRAAPPARSRVRSSVNGIGPSRRLARDDGHAGGGAVQGREEQGEEGAHSPKRPVLV